MSPIWANLLNSFRRYRLSYLQRFLTLLWKWHQLWKTVAPKWNKLMSSIKAHFIELRLFFKMSPNWAHLLNSFRRYELKKLQGYLSLIRKKHQLLELISSKRIELLSSTWAHSKELRLLFKMSPNWAQLLILFRRYEPTKLPSSHGKGW